MIGLHLIGGGSVLYARCERPFSMQDVGTLSRRLVQGDVPGAGLDTPAILDARAVGFGDVETDDIRAYMRQRRAMSSRKSFSPLAMVAGDRGSFGMMRMMGIIAENSGIRDEDRTIVTFEIEEAANWLAAQLPAAASCAAALLRSIHTLDAEARGSGRRQLPAPGAG